MNTMLIWKILEKHKNISIITTVQLYNYLII